MVVVVSGLRVCVWNVAVHGTQHTLAATRQDYPHDNIQAAKFNITKHTKIKEIK